MRVTDPNYQSSDSERAFNGENNEEEFQRPADRIHVSKYYQIRPQEVAEFLMTHKILFRD